VLPSVQEFSAPFGPRSLSRTRVTLGHRIGCPDGPLAVSAETYHLSRDSAQIFADILEKRRPQFLMGYPSALEALTRCAGKNGGTWRPKAVLFSSEPLHEHQRAVIKAYVSAPVRGFYSCAERVASAAQCEFGTYHVSLVSMAR